MVISVLSTGAFATVSDATPGSNVSVYGGAAGVTTIVRSDKYGTNTAFFNQNRASATVGQTGGLPVLMVSAKAEDTGDGIASADASLSYFWKVTSIGALHNTPVLVHISTTGWVDSMYGFDPFQLNHNNFSTGNPTQAGAEADFTLHMANGVTQSKSLGVNMAAPLSAGGGVDFISPPSLSDSHNGGVIYINKGFTKSFDAYVMPNAENSILLRAKVGFHYYGLISTSLANQYYSVSAYIDPLIEIDSAFANDYKLEVSSIPTVAVPEPDSIWLAASGAALLAVLRRRRKQASRVACL